MARDYVPIPYEYLEEMEELSEGEFGRLVRALIAYSRDEKPMALTGNERFYAKRVMAREDRYKQSFESYIEDKRNAGLKSAEVRKKKNERRSTAGNRVQQSSTALNRSQQRSTEANRSQHTETDTDTETETNTESLSFKPGSSHEQAKLTKTQEKTTTSAELQRGALSSTPIKGAPVISLTLNDGSLHVVTQADVAHWAELYPAVDILQELRKMAGWLESNPAKRKTKRGIARFITSWLGRTQDRGGNNGFVPQKGGVSRDSGTVDRSDQDSTSGWHNSYFDELLAEYEREATEYGTDGYDS